MKRMTTRHQWAALIGLALMASQAGVAEEGLPNASVLHSDQARLGYALGMDLGTQLRRQAVAVDPAVFARALSDGLAGGPTLMTPDEVRAEIGKLQTQLMRRQAEASAKAGAVGTAPSPTPERPQAADPAGAGSAPK